jgi:hypothetical protein
LPLTAPVTTSFASMSLPDFRSLCDADVLAVIDTRGGAAYLGSVETGLFNRAPYAQAPDRRRAIERALASGAIVRTPLGLLRRPPQTDE